MLLFSRRVNRPPRAGKGPHYDRCVQGYEKKAAFLHFPSCAIEQTPIKGAHLMRA
ncbi:hypothetical protein predicted by Glimmer/Critica [Acetobacter ghanensis]|uniref:Uncharacterized protein n=1 Tax=Acetobacter ghanensis TaxID=431306 RepID=A0A0U5F2N3_9PROT|nr:hypothetical protein predicted by Glimmer/Critica [Acetobacter ghanensis]